jgi:hypothetical protein
LERETRRAEGMTELASGYLKAQECQPHVMLSRNLFGNALSDLRNA